eukprot:UN02717
MKKTIMKNYIPQRKKVNLSDSTNTKTVLSVDSFGSFDSYPLECLFSPVAKNLCVDSDSGSENHIEYQYKPDMDSPPSFQRQKLHGEYEENNSEDNTNDNNSECEDSYEDESFSSVDYGLSRLVENTDDSKTHRKIPSVVEYQIFNEALEENEQQQANKKTNNNR